MTDLVSHNQATADTATPPLVRVGIAALVGFVMVGATLLWLQNGATILLQLSTLSAAFICL